MNIPNGVEALPWSVVFLVVFLSVSSVSAVMSMIDTWRAQAETSTTPRPLIPEPEVTTKAPLVPKTVQRRYTIESPPARPYDFLYSDTSQTR